MNQRAALIYTAIQLSHLYIAMPRKTDAQYTQSSEPSCVTAHDLRLLQHEMASSNVTVGNIFSFLAQSV